MSRWENEAATSSCQQVFLGNFKCSTFLEDFVLFYVAQAGLDLTILLPQPPKGWDYRCGPPGRKVIHFLIPQITLKQLVHLSPAELICDQFISQRMFIMKGLAQKVNPHIFMQMLYFKSFFIPQRPTNIAMNQNDAL